MDIVMSPLLTEKVDVGGCGRRVPAKLIEQTRVFKSKGSLRDFVSKSRREKDHTMQSHFGHPDFHVGIMRSASQRMSYDCGGGGGRQAEDVPGNQEEL